MEKRKKKGAVCTSIRKKGEVSLSGQKFWDIPSIEGVAYPSTSGKRVYPKKREAEEPVCLFPRSYPPEGEEESLKNCEKFLQKYVLIQGGGIRLGKNMSKDTRKNCQHSSQKKEPLYN